MATYLPLLLLFVVAAAIVVGMFTATSILGPKLAKGNEEKMLPFECGSDSTGTKHVKLSVKFYMTAILFVVLDVEVVLLYPWIVTFRESGWSGLMMMFPFVALLVVGLLYEWKKGAMEWER